jgi:hypothetical protein
VGLRVPPTRILSLIDRLDLHELVLSAYEADGAALIGSGSMGFQAEIGSLASTSSAESKFFAKA